jgi:hypothetical protein
MYVYIYIRAQGTMKKQGLDFSVSGVTTQIAAPTSPSPATTGSDVRINHCMQIRTSTQLQFEVIVFTYIVILIFITLQNQSAPS